jgi:FlaA1/EpsC-like NDP-sugar epimerase
MIADKLIIGKKPVVLYGAGTDAFYVILSLKSMYSVIPTCICDSDKSKAHKTLQGLKYLRRTKPCRLFRMHFS